MTIKVNLISIILLSLLEVLHSLDIGDYHLATHPAHTLATYRQLLTSSTLSWADISWVQSGKIPGNRVVVAGDSAVCRVRDGDKLRPGRTDLSGLCLVDGVKEREYQVLVDLTGLARVEWRKWDMFSNPEIGTVAYNERTFVAQVEGTTGDRIIGDLDFNRGLNGEILVHVNGDHVNGDQVNGDQVNGDHVNGDHVNGDHLSDDHVLRMTAGWALVELEPLQYRLENVSFLAPRESSSTVFNIGSVTLVSSQVDSGEEWQEEQEVIEYSYPGYEHWGHILGTVKGLPASAIVGRTSTQFRMGLEEKMDRTGQYLATYSLQPGTGVNMTVSGYLVRREVPYTALLVMVYKDGALTRQTVSSTYISVSVQNITQDTRGPLFTKTGLPAPTTTRRPSTTPPPSTPTQRTVPPFAHLFLVPTPTPTLFPPPPAPVTKPNPLRQFYPEMEEQEVVTDSVQVVILTERGGGGVVLPRWQLAVLLVLAAILWQ